ncbi:hypothetical protein COOONC_15543 [Cooperia oncophora]
MELYQINPSAMGRQSAWMGSRRLLKRSRKLCFHTITFDSATLGQLYNSLVMDDQDTRRLLNAKLTTRGKEKGALVELLYPTIYKLSCLLDLRQVLPIRCTVGHLTIHSSIILRITRAMQSVPTNCIDNEGWSVLKTSVERQVNHYDCCPNNYTLLVFHLNIQRKPLLLRHQPYYPYFDHNTDLNCWILQFVVDQ